MTHDVRPLPVERRKTLLVLCYLLGCIFLTTICMQLVNTRIPDISVAPPLGDVMHFVKIVGWMFTVTEMLGLWQMGQMFLLLAFHKHRLIVLRRMFMTVGTLYLYRCATLLATTLPVTAPEIAARCPPKLEHNVLLVTKKIALSIIGAGMSVTNNNVCGDYLYSGHTLILVLSATFLIHYVPVDSAVFRRCPLLYNIWYYSVLMGTFVGIIGTVLSREHYSIDVIVAYFFTTRMVWAYHSICDNQMLKTEILKTYTPLTSSLMETNSAISDKERDTETVQRTHLMLSRFWWARFVAWSEKNVHREIYFEYENPLEAFQVMLDDVRYAGRSSPIQATRAKRELPIYSA